MCLKSTAVLLAKSDLADYLEAMTPTQTHMTCAETALNPPSCRVCDQNGLHRCLGRYTCWGRSRTPLKRKTAIEILVKALPPALAASVATSARPTGGVNERCKTAVPAITDWKASRQPFCNRWVLSLGRIVSDNAIRQNIRQSSAAVNADLFVLRLSFEDTNLDPA